MPVEYKIDLQKKLITQTVWGETSFSDLQNNREKMRKDPDFDPSFSLLWDGTKVVSLAISSDEIRTLSQNQVYLHTSRVAFVAPQNLVFGLARMFEAYYSMHDNPARTRVFRHRADALEWLEAPYEPGCLPES